MRLYISFIWLITFFTLFYSNGCGYGEEAPKINGFIGKIVFVKNYKVYVLDGENKKLEKIVREGRNFAPKWSPDGTKIAFLSIRPSHSQELYIIDSDGKNQRRLTNTNGIVLSYRWDSKGKGIYFTLRERNILKDCIIEINTRKVQEMSSVKLPEVRPLKIEELMKKRKEDVEKYVEDLKKDSTERKEKMEKRYIIIPSPDEKYVIRYYEEQREIFLVNMLTNEQRELVYGGALAWSKNSKKIAYFKDPSPRETMVIFDIEKNESTEIIVFKGDYEYAECGGLSWSRDSRKIVYDCGPVAGPGEVWLYILDIETRKFLKLIQGYNPDWY